MTLDKKTAKRFTRLKIRLANLEKASEAREGALKQLAERLDVELDLTRRSTPEEEFAADMVRKSSKHLLESEEVIAYLKEPGEDDAR